MYKLLTNILSMEGLEEVLNSKEKSAIVTIEKILSANNTYHGKLALLKYVLRKLDKNVDEILQGSLPFTEWDDLPF